MRHEFRDERNRMISLHSLDEERKQRVTAPGRQLSNQMVVGDTGAILEFLRRGEPVRSGGAGAIGYCMGGRHVLCVAGHFPEQARAARDWELIFAMFHRQIPARHEPARLHLALPCRIVVHAGTESPKSRAAAKEIPWPSSTSPKMRS